MKRLMLLIFFVSITSFVNAQQDTIYVLYQNVKSNSILKLKKHRDDPEPKAYYPFDGGRHYKILKESKSDSQYDFTFVLRSYTPKWMDNYQFSYQVVDSCIFSKRDFKDAAWFDSKSSEIAETFSGRDKVIYLIDETEITNKKKIYMVRVYFSYSSPE